MEPVFINKYAANYVRTHLHHPNTARGSNAITGKCYFLLVHGQKCSILPLGRCISMPMLRERHDDTRVVMFGFRSTPAFFSVQISVPSSFAWASGWNMAHPVPWRTLNRIPISGKSLYLVSIPHSRKAIDDRQQDPARHTSFTISWTSLTLLSRCHFDQPSLLQLRSGSWLRMQLPNFTLTLAGRKNVVVDADRAATMKRGLFPAPCSGVCYRITNHPASSACSKTWTTATFFPSDPCRCSALGYPFSSEKHADL
jgi:hypothetical protein